MGQQLSDVYIKMTSKFRPMNLPVGHVMPCTSVLSRYVVGNGDAIHCDENGDPQVPTWPPTLQGQVVDGATLVLDYDIEMLVDSQLGISATVDGLDAPITSVTADVYYIEVTLTTPVTAGQVATVTYNSALGNIRSNATVPVDAPSFNDLSVNNITV